MMLPLFTPIDLPLVDLDAPGESWRVVLIPLGITPRRPRLVSEHATENDALDAAVRVASGIVGWSVDVLPPVACEISRGYFDNATSVPAIIERAGDQENDADIDRN